MEEEYRMQKAQSESYTSVVSPPAHDGETTLQGESSTLDAKSGDADDDASTRGVRSAAGTPMHSPQPTVDDRDGAEAGVEAVTNGIPTIRISTESTREQVKEPTTEPATNGAPKSGEGIKEAAEQSLEKPVQAAAGEGNPEGNGDVTPNSTQQEAFSFSNKRLCERWLDNLFMVLYEVSESAINTLQCSR